MVTYMGVRNAVVLLVANPAECQVYRERAVEYVYMLLSNGV